MIDANGCILTIMHFQHHNVSCYDIRHGSMSRKKDFSPFAKYAITMRDRCVFLAEQHKTKEANFNIDATCTKSLSYEPGDTVAKRPRAWHSPRTKHKKETFGTRFWHFSISLVSRVEPCRNHPTNPILVCHHSINFHDDSGKLNLY